MAKHCWICKGTEDFFLNQKNDLLKSIEQEISECERIEASIIDVSKEKLGFTDESKTKVKGIQPVYSEMTLKAVLENKENFLKLEPNLNIVLEYCVKYELSNLRTVGDVIEKFLIEPLKSRYQSELSEYELKKARLLQQKEGLEGIKTFFIEKVITPHVLDSNIQESRRIAEDYNRGYAFPANRKILKKGTSEQNSFGFSYENLGFEFERKIYICPICQSLFLEASNASFDIIEAQRKAQHDAEAANWDDGDDWGDEDW